MLKKRIKHIWFINTCQKIDIIQEYMQIKDVNSKHQNSCIWQKRRKLDGEGKYTSKRKDKWVDRIVSGWIDFLERGIFQGLSMMVWLNQCDLFEDHYQNVGERTEEEMEWEELLDPE